MNHAVLKCTLTYLWSGDVGKRHNCGSATPLCIASVLGSSGGKSAPISEALFDAMKKGEEAAVRDLLAAGVDMEARNPLP